jgi:PEP-CTERM motif
MTLGRKQLVFAVAVTSFISLAAAQPAHALLMISGTVGGINFCATDNNVACGFGIQLTDTNAAANRIELDTTTIGGVAFTGAAQQATFGPSNNILNTSFLQATNNTGGTILGSVAVSATNFIGPANQAFASGSATYQSAVGTSTTIEWYNDPNNAQGALTPATRPGTMIATTTKNVTLLADSLSFNAGPIAVNDPGLFSMTIGTNFSISPGATIVGNSQTELKPLQTVVPEPATLALFGSGLTWLAARQRRRRQSR